MDWSSQRVTHGETRSERAEVSVARFAESLPQSYRERFNPAQIAAHAHASVRRPQGGILAANFPWNERDITAVCVVADDRPGLLARISGAFSELGFDVDSAAAYTREIEPAEAVDVFWLRDPDGAVDEQQLEAFSSLLVELLSGRQAQPKRGPAPSDERGTTVRFLEDPHGALSVLEIETEDRSGLLWAITSALFEQGVQIVSSQVKTEHSRVFDRFALVELDGSPIRAERRLNIQVAVLSAVQL